MMTLEQVDGNALAGALMMQLAGDPTVLEFACGGCGAHGQLAIADVERDDVAAIVRCPQCTHTLFTLLSEGDGVRVVFAMLRSITRVAP